MTALPTSPVASPRPSGSRLSKAERLEQLTDPYGPTFPLDSDLVVELAPYAGPVPRSVHEYLALLPNPTTGQ